MPIAFVRQLGQLAICRAKAEGPQHGLQFLLPSTLHVSAEAPDHHDDGTIRKQAK
jgi:hypothetical protein